VPVYLQDHSIKAVVDTAAAVTIISDKIYRELMPKPPCLKKVTLHTAGRDLKMSGFVAGPVSLKLGLSTFSEVVYVAPIQDDMLLGLDFLLKHGVSIKLGELQLQVSASDEVAIEVISSNIEEATVAKVTEDGEMQVSSCSTLRLESNSSQELTGNTLPRDESRTWLAVLISEHDQLVAKDVPICKSEHDQLVAKDVPICKVLPRFADGSGEKIQYTGPVSDVTSVIQDDTQGSMSSGYSCLVGVPEDLPSICLQYAQQGLLLVKSMTKWPWDPGGSSEEGTLFREHAAW
ncbi:MAG: retropepsin-like domain-containing protein, partial [Candidatus Thiodiazotropha taylori]|nr:retropepsin-like domain-containing protein [Candidatus Thiodiazotropha taylori]